MIVTREHHTVLVGSIMHLRAEAMRLMPRIEENAAPLAPQMASVIDSLVGLEHELEDIQPGEAHDLHNITQGLLMIGRMLTEVASHLDQAKVIRDGRTH
jgi:hypothetical protein